MMCKFECTHFRVALSWPLYANMTLSIKPQIHNERIMPPDVDRTTAMGNMHKNWANSGIIVPEICSGQTTQTYMLLTILRFRTGVE